MEIPRDAALILVDIQQGFNEPRWGPRNNAQLAENVASLLKGWRATGRPVLHVRHNSASPKGSFHPSKPGVEFMSWAKPEGFEPILTKKVHSAFIGTDLEGRLRDKGIRTVVVIGIQTNFCVASTARMASNLGFNTIIVGDACATFDQVMLDGTKATAQLAHDMALGEFHPEFGTVVKTMDLVEAVGKPSAEPRPSGFP